MTGNPPHQAKGFVLAVLLYLTAFNLSAQRDTIQTAVTTDAEYLIREVFLGGGDCFEVFNIQLTGEIGQAGVFTDGNSAVGFEHGIVLSNGNIDDIAGPNEFYDFTTNLSTGYGNTDSDPDIDTLSQLEGDASLTISDVVVLEFDFVPTLDSISFDFVFASEEYCEFTLSTFIDLFGFFISGPGINGPYSNNGENIAVVPNTNQAITARSISQLFNSQYYINNIPPGELGCSFNMPAPAADIFGFDGLTVPLTARAAVIPCETYHLKLVVSDRGFDDKLDAAVFLKGSSFAAGRTARLSGGVGTESPNPIEGCSNTNIIFSRGDSVLTDDLIIRYSILSTSTATSNVDYTGLPDSLIIPAGVFSDTIEVEIIADNLPEGTEFFTLKLQNPCDCGQSELTVFIEEPLELSGTIDGPDFICIGDGVPLLVTPQGGFGDIDYLWSNGDVDSLFNDVPISDQTYQVILTDGCNQIDTITHFVAVQSPAGTIDGDDVLCDGRPSVDFPIVLTGGNSFTFDVIEAGVTTTYSNIMVDTFWIPTSETAVFQLNNLSADGCDGTTSGFASIFSVEINTSAEIDSLNCFADQDAAISLMPDGGNGQYTYQWDHDNNLNGPQASNLGSGTYPVYINDSQGCLDTIMVNISEPDLLELAIDTLQLTANCLEGGSLEGSISGGTAPYSFSWSDGSTTAQINDLVAGNYIFSVIDAEGCISNNSTNILADSIAPNVVLQALDSLDCVVTEVVLDASLSDQGAEYVYQWTDSNNMPISPADPLAITVSNQDAYTLSILNTQNGCSAESSLSAIDNTNNLTFSIEADGVIDCDNSSVQLFIRDSIDNWQAEWRDLNGAVLASNTWTYQASTPATYQVVVTNPNTGCNDTSEFILGGSAGGPVLELATILNDTLDCLINQVDLMVNTSGGSGNFSYQWTGPTGGIVGDPTQEDISVMSPGLYTLISIDQMSNCSDTLVTEVIQDIVEPIIDALPDTTLNCLVQSIAINASSTSTGNLQYEWFDASGMGIANTNNVTLASAGTYSLTLTNTDNGCTAGTIFNLPTDTNPPVLELANSTDTLDCVTNLVTINANVSTGNGNYSYQWTGPAGGIDGSDQLEDISVNLPGTYSWVVTDNVNGCIDTLETMVFEDLVAPVLNDFTSDTLLNCAVTSIAFMAASSSDGNLTYEWFDATGTSISQVSTVNLSNNGTYNITLTNTDNGCIDEATINVSSDITPPLVELVALPDTLDCLVGNVLLDANVISGSGDYDYQWAGPSGGINGTGNQEDIDAFEPGDYTLIVVDNSNGCNDTLDVLVTEAIGSLVIDPIPDTSLTCIVDVISLTAQSPSIGNLVFEWFDAANTSIQNGSTITLTEAGSYTVSVTDIDNNCSQSRIVTVGLDTITPNIITEEFGKLDCVISSLELSAEQGPTNQTPSWFDESGTPLNTNQWSQEVSNAGSYSLQVIDTNNGCMSTANYVVSLDTIAPVASIDLPQSISCLVDTVELTNTITSGSGDYTFVWDGPATGIVGPVDEMQATVVLGGNYQLTITDQANGCVATLNTMVIADNIDPELITINDTLINCYHPTINLLASSVSPGTLSYRWEDENGMIVANVPSLTINQAGEYTIVLTNTENGCEDQLDLTVLNDSINPTVDAGEPAIITCGQGDAILTGIAGPSNFTPSWMDENGNTITTGSWSLTTANPGTYELVVIDNNNGCEASDFVAVSLDQSFPIADAGNDLLLDCFTGMVFIDASNSSTGNDISYQLLDANGLLLDQSNTPGFNIESAGNYELVVINTANNCQSSDNVMIMVDEPSIASIQTEDIPCLGGNTGSIELETINGGTPPYLYSVDGGISFQSNNIFTGLTDGNYDIIVQDAMGCEAQESVNIFQSNGVSVALPEQLNLSPGETITLNPIIDRDTSMLFSFNWSASDQLACDKCIENIFTASETEILAFTVVDNNGCSATANLLIIVDPRVPIYVPNAFSPDGDGTNDRFTVYGDPDQVLDIAQFQVFDRWGSNVYAATNVAINDPGAGWDGTREGVVLNSNVFVYLIEVRLRNGKSVVLQGDILLIE